MTEDQERAQRRYLDYQAAVDDPRTYGREGFLHDYMVEMRDRALALWEALR